MKLVLVGEAWGKEEEAQKAPFVGASGQLLTQMLRDAGIDRQDTYITNVFNFRPHNNDVLSLCVGKKEIDKNYPLPPLAPGRFLDLKYFVELDRLYAEIAKKAPNLIVALGNTAMWALTSYTGIKSRRGAITTANVQQIAGIKVLPTIHPSAVLRDWSSRVVVVADLMKAKREACFPDIRIPERMIWLDPTLEDLYDFQKLYITDFLGCDIETARNQVLCISLSPTPYLSIVLPFVDRGRASYSYWKTPEEEVLAYRWLKSLLESSKITKLFQNGAYDVQYLYHKLKIKTKGFRLDTMLHHHAQQPELPKSLGFMGSLHTSEASWKNMRPKGIVSKKDE